MENGRLPRSQPELQGVSSNSILSFINAVESENLELHSFMLLRHGTVVAEGWWKPYTADRRHTLNSLSKSFTSTAVGFAVLEGLLSVDDSVISFFPEEVTADLPVHLPDLKVHHLLTMSSGHASDPSPTVRQSTEWVRRFLHAPFEFAPGTHFVYNTAATYMLSAILQRVTGQTLIDYLEPRLFKPLAIENPVWESCPQGINFGGFGLNVRTEDIAKFGQLYLQRGVWENKRILGEKWIDTAVSAHVSNGDDQSSDWTQGYGYQFWRCTHGAFRGDGAFGQFCIVIPKSDVVLAITAGTTDMQKVLDLVWAYLLPGFQGEGVPSLDGAETSLKQKLESLDLCPSIGGQLDSQLARKISGRNYKIDRNDAGIESITFRFDENTCALTLHHNTGSTTIRCGSKDWEESTVITRGASHRVAAKGRWTGDTVFEITWCFLETPLRDTVLCHFEGSGLRIEMTRNVGVGPLSDLMVLPPMTGSASL